MQYIDSAPARSSADQVRRLLRIFLPTSQCTAAHVARVLRMDRRTLHRRLEREGTGFQALLDEIRFDVAREMLQDDHIPVFNVAQSLGYSDPSAFTRAFRRWSRLTPVEWRVSKGH